MGRVQLLVISLILLVAPLAGCSRETVAKDVNLNQANEIVAVLNGQGLSAQIEESSQGRGKYSVSVREEQYSPSVAVLNDRGLPKRSRFQEIVEPQGLIPNSREMEALRVDYARSLEVQELLQSHPAVSSAAVTVSRDYAAELNDAGAAVILSLRSGKSLSKEEVVELVSRVVPGIKVENIAVSMHALGESANMLVVEGATNVGGKLVRVPLVTFLFGLRVAEDDYGLFVGVIFGFLFLVALLASILGFSYGSYRGGSAETSANLPEVIGRARLDRLPRGAGED